MDNNINNTDKVYKITFHGEGNNRYIIIHDMEGTLSVVKPSPYEYQGACGIIMINNKFYLMTSYLEQNQDREGEYSENTVIMEFKYLLDKDGNKIVLECDNRKLFEIPFAILNHIKTSQEDQHIIYLD